MSYTRKWFDPPKTSVHEATPARRRSVYVYDNQDIVLAVNVAISTGRPLLIRGPSGSGKSSLARNVALTNGWGYYEHPVTSRTQAQDLLWSFDALQRLHDAQAHQLRPDRGLYVDPGVLWWAINRTSARTRGLADGLSKDFPPKEPGEPGEKPRAVVLLDEIDKADPDVPNGLLVPLDAYRFTVRETGATIEAANPKEPPLLVLTTNNERELPRPFVRRCVVLELDAPSPTEMLGIAQAHFGNEHLALYKSAADTLEKLVKQPGKQAAPEPSIAEFLDAVRAAVDLKVDQKAENKDWKSILRMSVLKPTDGEGAAP